MTRSTFDVFLEESGCSLNEGDTAPMFLVEPVLFRRQLALKLRGHPEFPGILDTFFASMQDQTEDVQQLRRCLMPAALTEDTPQSSSRTSRLESLFKTLLAIDIVQPKIVAYLLERLPEFYDELENDDSSTCTARLILHQLRWLDYIVEPHVLTEKLVEIIQITPSSIQHEIITSLPDIINDSEHKPVVLYLKELMNENAALTVPILDALSNLTMHSESLEDVHETVLERLESADLDDLAVIVKFLLQTVNQHSIDRIVYGIRQKLDFYALGKVQQTLPTTSADRSSRSNSNHSPEALILESIKLGLQFHKYVCDAWVRSIVALETQSAHKVIDVLVLIILHSMTSMKKKAEQIFRKKIIHGLLTPQLLQATVLYHADGLAGYWNTFLTLSESLLRSCAQHSGIGPCSSALYISAFKSCDAYYRQEIVGSLVTHIGSGSIAEMDVALDVLLKLVKTDTADMSVYGVFIKGILDYLDNLNFSQLRVLFDIFSTLALSVDHQRDANAASLWSDIQIVIRKQLSNPRERYKNIGVLGCLSAVKTLGSKSLCQDTAVGSSTQDSAGASNAAQALRHPKLKQAVHLLEMVMRNCAEYPNCLVMTYDELAHILANQILDERLQLWIKENLTSDFTDSYVDGVDDMDQGSSDDNQTIKPALCMNLDGEDGEIVIKLLDLFHCPDEKKRRILVVQLCSVFNLMQNCEKRLNHGSLEEIDALLGCGVVLFKLEDIDELTSDLSTKDMENVCDALFCAINWFRELLNAFSSSLGDGTHEKLIQRLKNILQLESLLQKLMKHVPWFVPLELHASLPANAEGREIRGTILSSARLESARSTQIASQGSEGDLSVGARREGGPKPSTLKFEAVTDLRTHMRALHLDVLCMLKKPQQDSDNIFALSYTEINYILEDLNLKLDIKIVPPPTTFFAKKKSPQDSKHGASNATMLARISATDLMKKMVVYLPFMLQTLETLYEDIQLENTQSDNLLSESADIAKSISHMFNILNKMLSWPELQNPDNQGLFNEFIQTLASRMAVDGQSNSPDVIRKEAFQYLARFGENMPHASTAVVLFKTLLRLMEIAGKENAKELKESALAVVAGILTTDWSDWRDIKKDIPFLVEQTIELCDNPLHVLNDYVNVVLPEYDREGHLEEHPLLRGDTVVSFYQALVNQTVKALDILKDTDQDVEVVLVQNATIVKIFERITNYIKMKEQRTLFSVLLKTDVFKQHKDAIVGIFKDFQTSTRMLQIICSHVKASKDVSLSAHVPPLKKALESVIYQVKMLLSANNAPSDAFFMGALKHRDIRGAEVSSQLPREESSDSEVEEDQLIEESSSASSKRRQSPPTPQPDKKRKRPAAQPSKNSFRTTSQVPSSSEEDEEEIPMEDANDPDPIEEEEEEEEARKVKGGDDEDDEEVLIFNLESDEEEDSSKASREATKPFDLFSRREEPEKLDQQRPKKRRLGIGRPNPAKRASALSHTSI